jgi:uncharacterized protein YnzC (UPF0291/DUF896 family)
MIIYTYQKSKKKKKLTAKERELQDSWNKIVNKHATPSVVRKKIVKTTKFPKLTIPDDRNPYKLNSVDSGGGLANWNRKDKVTQYTGTAMKGIGTLHKSNAVPVFTDEEAKDQATMRR